MKEIMLTRIDDRLIHGQVVTSWIKHYPINQILVIDNELSQNKMLKQIYTAAAPSGVSVLIKNIDDSINYLQQSPLNKENIMILVKIPEIIEQLLKANISIEKVILGGMGAGPGRKRFHKNVSASETEIKSFKKIIESGVEIIYQMVPNDKALNTRSLLKL